MSIGHIGKILEVNLFTRETTAVDLDAKVVKYFLGGLGLGIKILYDEVGPNVDALSDDNIIVIAPGPLSGTAAPTNGRTHIITKSPLTGIIGMGNFGGWWGPRLKRAGFEGVIIRGRSNSPVYLSIDGTVAQLRSADHLWGKDSWETTAVLKEELENDVSVLCIGQAGENLVRFACPVSDYYHAPGRSHAGCVMGQKKLKAIAVRGTEEVPVADPGSFKEAVKEVVKRIVGYPERGDRQKIGSHSSFVKDSALAGLIRTGDFATGDLPPDSDLLRLPESYEEHVVLEPGYYGYHCPMAQYYGCNLMADVKTGPYAGLKLGGICYAMVGSEFGGRLGIKSYPAMFKCRELCQRYGMDEKTRIPFAMELFEKGIIKNEDLGGLDLKAGNEFAIMEMIGKIAHREGFGKILADGTVRAAEMIGKGAESYVLTIKGHQIMLDPRTSPSWAHNLGQVTCPRGGDDLNTTHYISDMVAFPGWAREAGWSEAGYLSWLVDYLDMFDHVKEQIFGSPPRIDSIRRDTLEGKAALVIWFEQIISIFDSLGLCMMAGSMWSAMGPTHYAKLYSACTGWQITPRELIKTGDRIFNLMKAYNVRQGLTRKDDDYPARYYQEPIMGGPAKGVVLSRAKMNRLLDEYYDLREWDRERGVPTKKKLIELDLDYVANELSKKGLIPE
jgi:aldehyde:ferredoxin oxidoreductase